MHLVGFIIRIYHDARSFERQVGVGHPYWSWSQAVSKSAWHTPLLRVQWKTPDDGQRNFSKHVEFYSKNKFEKWVHLVGFIIRIYHDARSSERQVGIGYPSWSCSQAVSKPVWHIPLLCVQWKNTWWWIEELSETRRVVFQNEFEKSVHLVGFMIRIYHDARSFERQVCVGHPNWSCSQAVSKPVWHIPLLCVQWKTPDDGQRNCPNRVEFYSKNEFEKLVHVVAFIISILCAFVMKIFHAWPKYLPVRYIASEL